MASVVKGPGEHKPLQFVVPKA